MPSRPPEPPLEPPYDPRFDPRRDPRRGDYADEGRQPYDDRYDPREPSDYQRQFRDEPPSRPADPRHARSGGAMPPPPVPPRGRGYDDRDPPPAAATARRRRVPLWAILAGLVALLLVGFFAFGLTRSGPGEDRLDGNSASDEDSQAANTPAERCGSKQTYDQVKGELFRQAAATRGGDQAIFNRLAAYATLRMEAPVLKRQDENVGTLVCSARAALDLPPGVEVAGGRRTLTAALDYSLQDAADGSGQVVTLAGADAITVPLATLARSTGSPPANPATTEDTEPSAAPDDQFGQPPVVAPANTPQQQQQQRPQPQTAPPSAPRPAPTPTQPQPGPTVQTSTRPSFNCRFAKTRGEIAVCRDPGLASLDRQMSAVYVRASRNTSPQTIALLQRTRNRFLGYRDRCTNDACIAGAYRDRIREINDIMEGRWQP